MIRILMPLVFLPGLAFAALEQDQDLNEVTLLSSQSTAPAPTLRETEFIEVEAQIHTISIAPTVTFGPSLTYQHTDSEHFGFRALAPFSRADDISVLSLTGFWRHMFTQKKTALFGEVGLSYNLFGDRNVYSNDSAGSADLSIGAIHRLTADLGFGGIAGITASGAQVERDFVNTSGGNSTYFYPRLALFGNMHF